MKANGTKCHIPNNKNPNLHILLIIKLVNVVQLSCPSSIHSSWSWQRLIHCLSLTGAILRRSFKVTPVAPRRSPSVKQAMTFPLCTGTLRGHFKEKRGTKPAFKKHTYSVYITVNSVWFVRAEAAEARVTSHHKLPGLSHKSRRPAVRVQL